MGVFGRRKKKTVVFGNADELPSPVTPDAALQRLDSSPSSMRLSIRRKKKSAAGGSGDSTQPDATRSDSNPVAWKNSGIVAKVFSPRSFRTTSKKQFLGLPLSPTWSPVSELEQSNSGLRSDSFGEAVHHSAKSVPTLSPIMAAVEARTKALQKNRDDEENSPTTSPRATSSSLSRPERKRTLLSFNSMKKKSTLSNYALSQNWQINLEELTIGKTIGHSSFGTVSQGKLNGTKVAVKTITTDGGSSAANNLSEFTKEAEMNCKLRHPNIVLFMGIAIQPTKVCIVTELMSRGNVRDLLVKEVKGKPVRLDWSLRQQWALDTAQGMAYLHSLNPPMIHRDLKTTNLLVDRGMNVKICDFGLSRFRSDKLMSAVGTVHFAAPEVLRNEMYTEKADLFSYGTVMWELYTRQVVFKGMAQIEVFNAVIEANMPQLDEECDERYRDLMNECWSLDVSKRPSFCEVIDRLTVLVDETGDSW